MLPFIEGEPLLSILPDAYEERKADLLRGTQDLRALTSEEEAAAETGDTDIRLGTLTLPAGEPPEPPG